jgi:flagellar basal-body rod modification protein FlgD
MSSTISPLSYTQVNPVTSSSSSSSSSSGTANSLSGVSANEGTFLTLLVAQLKNQDPLSPTDSTQFVGELAQFSSLEQLMTINQNVGAMTNVVAPSSGASTTGSSSSTAPSTAASSGASSSADSSAATGAASIASQLNSSLPNFGS